VFVLRFEFPLSACELLRHEQCQHTSQVFCLLMSRIARELTGFVFLPAENTFLN